MVAACAPVDTPGLPVALSPPDGFAWVVFGPDTSVVELADTPESRGYGLSGRSTLSPDEGMLFVWDDARVRSFWMEDTHVALDIAFLDPAGVVLDIRALTPLSEDLVNSPRPVSWALELPRGRLESMGVAVGDTLHIQLPGHRP